MLNYQRVLHNWETRHPSGPSNNYFRVPFWCLLQGKEQPSPTLAVASEWNGEMERVLTYSHISKVSLGSCIHRLKGIRRLFSESVIMVPAISNNTECHSRSSFKFAEYHPEHLEHNCTTEHTHLRQTIKHCIQHSISAIRFQDDQPPMARYGWWKITMFFWRVKSTITMGQRFNSYAGLCSTTRG